MKPFNLAIASPSGETWKRVYGLSLVMTTIGLLQKPVPGYQHTLLKILNEQGSILPKSRQEMCQMAIKAGCSHLLFIDTDQGFPAWTAHKLASHKKPVVAANIAVKRRPSVWTARNKSKVWPGGEVVHTLENSTGLEQVWRVGTGIMLIDLSIFEGWALPWFNIEWWPPINDFKGEDWYFCEKCEERGIPIYIDHDLSKIVKHVGDYEYGFEDCAKPEQILMTDKQGNAPGPLNPTCIPHTHRG